MFVWVRFAVGCGFCESRQSWLGSWVGVFGHGLWCCPSSVGCLWCSWLGFGFGLLMGRVWFCARPACPPPFPVPVCGVGARAGPGSWLCLALSWLGCRGVFFALFFWLCGVGCWVSLSRTLWSLSPHPLSLGLGCWLFSLFSGVCLHVSVSLFPAGRCSWLAVAGFGWVVPLCLFGGPVFGAFWVGGLAASGGAGGWFGGCRLFSAPPPPPRFVSFFLGGGGCLFLPLPTLGWRTHWPAFSVVFRAAVGGCVLFGRVPAPWVRWAMYTSGSAPLLAGLGPGSAGWAGAPGGCMWLWVSGLGLFVSFPLCGAGSNLLGGPPPLLPDARWPLCVTCGAGVWRAGAAPSGVCGGLLRLVLQVRISRAVWCRSVPRRVASCCGALHCRALWCGVPWSRGACFGGACPEVRPRESCGIQWGWGGADPPVVVYPSWVWVVAFAVVPFSSAPWSPLLPLPGSWVVSCPHVVSLPAPCPYGCLPSLGAPQCSLA